MAFSLEDEDDLAFQAALSFADECKLDNDEMEDVEAFRIGALVQCNEERAAIAPREATVSTKTRNIAGSNRSRRMELNERKKLLRKAGIYGDDNWMSKDSRLEIAYLRERIEKLNLDVQVLHTRKGRQRATLPVSQNSTNTMNLGVQIPKVWEEIAGRQQRRLKAAERENARLKLAVQHQRNKATCLSNLMQKRVSHLTTDCSTFMDFAFSNQHSASVLSSRSGGARDFPLLFRHLEAARQEVDAVFASNGLANMVLTPNDVQIREGVDGKYLEAFSNKVLPFGLRAATEATWDHFKGSEKHLGNGNIYEKTAKSLDDPYTIVEEFTKEMHSKHARADIRAQQIVRRYVEPDRDIVIWVSIAEPAEIKHKMLRGLTYHLRGYAMTKRSAASTPENEVSQLQCVSLISLEPEAEAIYGSETVRAVTNFLIVNAAQKMQAHQDRIENALVDNQLKRRGYNDDSTRCKAPVHLTSREDKMRRRVEVNEKIRALRKAGVYADSNRVRNKRTRENCFPSRSTGKTTTCKEVDAVFAVNGLADMGETSDDVHIREGGDGTYAEAFSNKVLPFALRSATEATWDHFKGSEKHCGNGNIYEKTARQDLDEPYTIVEAFTKE
ncbi:M96 mating-specific protein family [Phytophthora infestans T30-4]|uniref:M96 mating-specific protein family n=1 Tax=Phytophthora infestans (strain T30-4) TaxID=403677 RepID=D0MZF8_PHYIT|nr:M96 mating-specific protein family [Phytophthora infestans T30-4]EEY65621.1 M96 mating-specific protein family [Phytophthora infestans T30-4]|eukprot:XP_002906220.1 M96 mating-specific protein family [Phytophthora infestans T30-4]